VKRWQSRYFELSGHYLQYFEDKGKKDGGNEEDNLRGTINLENLSFCTVDGSELHLELLDVETGSAFEIKVGGGAFTNISQHRMPMTKVF
jgi:hypothetical protein